MSWQPDADAGHALIPGLEGYTDLHLIAHGSTAMVFRATQARLNRTVAIKVLLVDDVMTTQANVARELETTVALSSQPHIVSIIDTGITDDGSPFIVMEYCEGGSYAQILKRRGPLPLTEVLEVGIKIGEALHAAHEVGIVHRDVKPPNILRSRFGPALADFGIARAADDGGAATSTLDKLTPHHASPEALLRGAQSGSSDLYSLASTMWNLLVGRPPFHDTSLVRQDPLAFRQRVLTKPMPRLPRDDVPEWLQHELGRAMAKDPADRHESAGAFAESLRENLARQRSSSPWAPQSADDPQATTVLRPGEDNPDNPAPDVEPDALTQWVRAPAPSTPAPPPWATPAPAPAAALAPPERAEPVDHPDEEQRTPSRGRPIAVMSVIGVLFGVLIVAVTSLLRTHSPDDTTVVTQSPKAESPTAESPPSLATQSENSVVNVRVQDLGGTVRLTWDNAKAADAPKLIVGVRTLPGSTPSNMGSVSAGATTALVNGLNAKVDYCFVVIAVHSEDAVARSKPACTNRITSAPSR